MGTGFQSHEDYWRTAENYYKQCYEKKFIIPNWMYFALLAIGLFLTVYNKLGATLLGVSIYQLAKRAGQEEGWLDGFNERGDLYESEVEEGTNLKTEMIRVIKHFQKKESSKE